MKSGKIGNLCVALVALVILSGYVATAQEKPAAEGGARPAAQSERPRNRLPAFFATVVNDKQRQEIYKIQESYSTKIEELQKQLEQLTSERDKEVDAVLSEEQLAEVNKRREAARQARTNRTPRPPVVDASSDAATE